MNCCCDCTEERSVVNRRLSVTTAGAISRGTEDSSMARKSCGERAAISSRRRFTGRSPELDADPHQYQGYIQLDEVHNSVLTEPQAGCRLGGRADVGDGHEDYTAGRVNPCGQAADGAVLELRHVAIS